MATSSAADSESGMPVDDFVSMAEAITSTGGDWAELKLELERRGYSHLAAGIDLSEETLPEPERCERCGGVRDEKHPAFDRGACRCGGRKRRCLSYLDAVDPDRTMSLSSAENDNESVDAALAKLGEIVSGKHKRGLFLLGLPGRGRHT